MIDKQYLNLNTKQYKANLHSHSTNSDGLLTPKEMIQEYKKRGYHVLAFSEHELYTNTEAFDDEQFLVLPGIERSIMVGEHETFHINGIGNPDSHHLYKHNEFIPVPLYESMEDVQKVINEMKEKDNYVVINHPYWSCNKMEHLHILQNYDALEIFNYGCKVSMNNGNSELYWEQLLWNQTIVNAFATDDNHNSHRYHKGITMWDSFGGWINILASEFSRSAIYQAILKGNFYASSGPEIYTYGVKGNQLYIQCSECKEIIFKTYPRRGYVVSKEQGFLSNATYDMRGQEEYARIICIDQYGRKAWTNIFKIQD